MTASFKIRRADVFAMALGAPGVRRSVFVAFGFIVLTWINPPGGSDLLVGDMIIAFSTTLLFPLVASLVLMSLLGAGRMIGETVEIEIDDQGVRGWPFWPDLDRSWLDLRSDARRFGGVITLPFDDYRSQRTGWVFMPERALTSEEISTLLMEARRGRAARRD